MARKGWSQLSPNYRKRLTNKGITEADYTAGVSLSKARGHERTPEHPTTAKRSKYPEYYSKRQELIRELEAKKAEIFGTSARWSEERSATHIRQKPVSNTMLRWAIKNGEQEWLDAIREDSEAFYFLGYH